MRRSCLTLLAMLSASVALAQTPQPARPVTSQTTSNQANVPRAVSVVHTINVQRMIEQMRAQQNLRVGVAGTAPSHIFNVTTGLIVDDQGHIVTRLVNLDQQDKEHKITVTTGDGTTVDATLIGVDFATGFAVLDVPKLAAMKPKLLAPAGLANGAAVKILSSDVLPKRANGKTYFAPSITVSQGHVLSGSIYATARGAMTLRSDNLLARSDGSIVVTPADEVVGMTQYAGFGRAYLYPLDFITNTVARRVLEKKDNVPAGWLGVKGDSVTQLTDAEISGLGLQRKAGVIVRHVTPQSSAAQAGLLPSDVITGVDGFEIVGTADLKSVLSPLPAGQVIKLKTLRARQSVEISVMLGARPFTEELSLIDQSFQPSLPQREQLEKRFAELRDLFAAFHKLPPSRETNEAIRELDIEIRQILDGLRAQGSEAVSPPSRPETRTTPGEIVGGNLTATDISFTSGFSAREINPQFAAILRARGGVLVSNVTKDSLADRSGLQAGDVIVGTQDSVLLNAAQLQALLSARRGAIPLNVVRNKQPIVLSLNLQ